jgi:putative ABC transport system permease protein
VGVSRSGPVFANPQWERMAKSLRDPDAIAFDARSRPEFGPIAELFRAGPVRSEIANQQVRIIDLFEMGASFSADGTAFTTQEGFVRLFPSRRPGLVDIGLIHLKPGTDVDETLGKLRAALPADVVAMTHDELNAREQIYWRSTTPAGFIFKTVLILSLLVGCVSAYQILYSDISENLRQYATLKAIGYADGFFYKLTFEKAWLLSSLAYPVGFVLAAAVYIFATQLTLVPLVMTVQRAIGVYIIILASCGLAGWLALNRLRRSDLSELF